MSGFFEQTKSKVSLSEGTHATMRPLVSTWEQRKFGELYRPVSEKNDMSFGRDKIISVANMYFNSVVYVTEDSYLATYNVMRLGDIAFEGNRSKRFAHGRFVENTIGDGIVSHVFKVFRPVGNNFDLAYWKHAINNEKLMKDVLTRSTKASTMMHELVSSDFLEESTLVPSLDEQRAIGTAIDSMDSLITLHQREPTHMMKEGKNANRYQ
ncbi:restriction endonuclease subunit S [Collinsella sp. AF38-3AC]|nr:restriction endonuclease subunit S [Collinsella sp. AF38-3AC]